MDPVEIERFHDQGFVVLRQVIDPGPLSREVDAAFADGFGVHQAARTYPAGAGQVTLRYLPMMNERTPVSLGLVDRLAVIATELLGRAVLPGRAKGTHYYGDTSRHRDSEHAVASVGCLAYLEPARAATGALRVLPGSHTDRVAAGPGVAVETDPGDAIVFDEHLLHGSTGGGVRRQWRADFVVDPGDAGEESAVRAWFAESLPDESADPGYAADRYPSYGPYWRARNRQWHTRLRELGVYG